MITPTIAIFSPGDRINETVKPLDTVPVNYDINPKSSRKYDIIICDTPNRNMLKEVIKHKFQSNILLFKMRGDPYWGIHHWLDSKIKQKVVLEMLGHVDACIALAEHQAEVYRNHTGKPTVIMPLSKDPESWPQTYHTSKRLKILTLTNPMYPTKIGPIIKNMPYVNEFLEQNSGSWLICGEGKYEHHLEIAADKYRNIEFLGFKNNKKMFNWANILLHPSDFDSFGHVILEGMACNMPVIASNHPAFTSRDWPINIFTDKNNLIKYLDRYKNPKERRYAGRHNYNHLYKNYTHEIVGQKWYQMLLKFKLDNSKYKTAIEMIENE